MKGLEAKTLGLKKMIRHEYKRIVAFMLTVAMVVTNFGTNLTVAFAAGEETSSLFLLDSSELEDAISTALESGEVFDFSSLQLKAKQKSLKTSYEKLMGSKAGKVYQLDVDVDSSYASENTDLQVFYNAGTDSVVFLFINESDMAVTFRANVSGYETARVTVNPNTSNIEDAEGVENAEDYSNTTMVDDEKKAKAEVVKPEGETSETDENGSDETAEETKADVTESETASENGETEETTAAEDASKEETTAAEETEAEAEETAAETEAAEPETEAPAEEELQPEEGSATASISAKEVFRVSTSAEVTEETLAEETEAEAEDKAEVPEKETEDLPETTEAEEITAGDKTEETAAEESKTDETTAADETKDGELIDDENKAPAEDPADESKPADENNSEAPADNNDGSDEVGFDGDEQFLEDDSIELMGELAGKAYNTVTIWNSANARAYAVKAEDLAGAAAVEGQYNVDYSVDPVGAAAIKGAHTVNEGETLYFAVDPQVGYEITEVTANGEELEEVDAAGVASASNLEKYAHVYAVEEVSEDLEIVASLEETADVAHPEFNASYVSSDGVTISLHAEEGILPEGTELDVTEVTEALGDTIKEKMESESDGAAVNTVLAYDINLLYNGQKLSNSWSEDGYVDVTFTGAPIQEMTEASDKVEIVAVDDTSKTQLTADKAETVEASELKLESVSEQNVEGAAVEEVGFKAEHFTIYAITGTSGDVVYKRLQNMHLDANIGTVEIYTDYTDQKSDKTWNSSDEKVIKVVNSTTRKINGKNCAVATLQVLGEEGNVVVSYGYSSKEFDWQRWVYVDKWNPLDSANITVGNTSVQAAIYYVMTPTTNPASNDQNNWCKQPIGEATVDLTGAAWENSDGTVGAYANTFDDVTNRVTLWPGNVTGSEYEVPKKSNEWKTLFDKFKSTVEKENWTDEDIANAKIFLIPYKISYNYGGYHLDCTVQVRIPNIYVATYYLWDAGKTGFVWQEAEKLYGEESVTKPSAKLANNCPAEKTVNDVKYTFVGWYDNRELTGEKVEFPYTVNSNINFYAKYVAGYKVNYNLAGGAWGLLKTVYSANEGELVTVKSEIPERRGYEFAGWTCSESSHNSHQPGGTFTMPGHDVTLTAKWTPSTNNKITVKHFFQNADGSYPAEETLTAENVQVITSLTTGATVTGARYKKNSTSGYTYDANISDSEKIVAADGSTVLRLYYTINTHKVTYRYNPADQPEGAQEQLPNTESYVYGATVSLESEPTLPGYTFIGWTVVEDGVKIGNDGKFIMPDADVVLEGHFEPTDVSYSVEYYYQNPNRTYPSTPAKTRNDFALNGTFVTITQADKVPTNEVRYRYSAETSANTISGTVSATTPLVLKVYFEYLYQVTYKPGDKGLFINDVQSGLPYGASTPNCRYDVNAAESHVAGYHFVEWNPTVAETVEGDQEYEAQWAANEDTEYRIAYYYQNEHGQYGSSYTSISDPKHGTTGMTVVFSRDELTPVQPDDADYTYTLDRHDVNVQISGDGTTVVNVYFKRQFTVRYITEAPGTFTEQKYTGISYGEPTPAFEGEKTCNPGYTFSGWSPGVSNTVTGSITYEAQWRANEGTKYTIEYYYQNEDGTWPTREQLPSEYIHEQTGKTDEFAELNDADKTPNDSVRYALDRIVDRLKIKGDGTTVLQVYFKYQYTVTYKPGELNGKIIGTFKDKTYDSLSYNIATPDFDGTPQGLPGYKFVGWSPAVTKLVTRDAVYTAQWEALSAKYYIDFYYQNGDGNYDTLYKTLPKDGATGTTVEVPATDRYPELEGFYLDEGMSILEGEVTYVGEPLHLKVYFRPKYTVIYNKGRHGTFEQQTYSDKYYGDATPEFVGEKTAEEGYEFLSWDPAVSETVTRSVTYTAQWRALDTTYAVEYYYQNADGTWPTNTSYRSADRTAKTGDSVSVNANDLIADTAHENYVVDESKDSEYSATAAGNGSTVLKVYFKLHYTVTYKPGNFGTFETQSYSGDFNIDTPEFVGEKTGKAGYTFVGWSPEVAEKLTQNATYVAQWSGLKVTKVVTDQLSTGDAFVEGNTIHFEITVENIGDVALADVTVKDTLADTEILPAQTATGDYNVVNGEAQIGTLAVGATVKVYASHVVTAEDVENKAFKNTAIVSHTNPVDPSGEKPEIPTETDVIPTKGVEVKKAVTSSAAAADGKYVVGEKVTFDITVTNKGNTKLGDFKVVDQLKNTTILDGAGYTVSTDAEGHAVATVNGLAVGASITIAAEHIVREADLRNEDFRNVAIAELTDPQNKDNPKKEEGKTDPIPTVDPDENWKVTKTVTNLPTRGYFHVGETAEFDIKVENTGNQALSNIIVADLLSGTTLKAGSGYTLNADGSATIAALKVGDAVTLKATYVVTSTDVSNKKFVNTAIATIGTETETGTTGDIPAGTTDNGGNNGGNNGGGSNGGGGGSSSGGGGGSSSGPRSNGSTPAGGPGATTVTIDPDAVPLANLPNDDTSDALLVIDDEDVPLAALPKTGQNGASGLVLFLSSMMLAAFVAVSKKREDDK